MRRRPPFVLQPLRHRARHAGSVASLQPRSRAASPRLRQRCTPRFVAPPAKCTRRCRAADIYERAYAPPRAHAPPHAQSSLPLVAAAVGAKAVMQQMLAAPALRAKAVVGYMAMSGYAGAGVAASCYHSVPYTCAALRRYERALRQGARRNMILRPLRAMLRCCHTQWRRTQQRQHAQPRSYMPPRGGERTRRHVEWQVR